MKISVCVPSIRPDTLIATINSIRAQTWENWELIVVGQGSNSDLKAVGQAAMRADLRIIYLHIEELGASIARNFALEAATGDIVALTDDDCEAREDWLTVIAEYFSKYPDTGVVAGSLMRPRQIKPRLAVCPRFYARELLYDSVASNFQEPYSWGWVSANVSFRRDTIRQVGSFDPYFGPGAIFPMSDDTDYRVRLQTLGIKTRTTPRSVIYHTYGFRYGIKPALQFWKASAVANGGFAAKLKLLGNPYGRTILQRSILTLTFNLMYRFRPLYSLSRFLGLWYYLKAYNYCLKEFTVDCANQLLVPLDNACHLNVL